MNGFTPVTTKIPAGLQFPHTWSWVLLTTVAKLESGHTPSRRNPGYWGGEVPWLSLKDIQGLTSRYITDTADKPTMLGIENSSARLLPAGTVALCRTASVGKVAILGREMATSQDFVDWVCGPKLNPEYLYWALFCSSAAFDVEKQGSTHKTIYMPTLERLNVLLPPPDVQKRVAAILDKADAIRRKRQEAIALTEQLLRSTFLEMFGDPVTNPKGWPEVTLGEVASIRTGKTPSRDNPANYGGSVPWVKTTEVRGGVILSTEEHLSDIGLKGMEVFPKGSILIAMYGQGATRGRVAVLGVDATTNQACAILIPKPRVNRDFLWTYLQLSYEPLRELGRGGNQPNLNLDLVRSFPLPLPPILIQQEFSKVHCSIAELFGRQREASQSSESLFNSLVQRAFTGQL